MVCIVIFLILLFFIDTHLRKSYEADRLSYSILGFVVTLLSQPLFVFIFAPFVQLFDMVIAKAVLGIIYHTILSAFRLLHPAHDGTAVLLFFLFLPG